MNKTSESDAEDDHPAAPLVRALVGRLVEQGIIDHDPEEYTVVREDTMRYNSTIQTSGEEVSEERLREVAQNAVRAANRAVNNQESSDENSNGDDSGDRLSFDEMCERMRSDE